MTTISASAAESESGVWDGALSYSCRRYNLWSVLHCCQVIKRVRCLVQCCDPPLKTHPLQMLWKGKNLHNLKSLYKWGKPMRRGFIYRELVEDIKKNGKGRDSHSSENMSYLKWGRRGEQAGQREETWAFFKTFYGNSWLLLRHLSSVWGSERAGGGCGQPLSNIDSVERQGAGLNIAAARDFWLKDLTKISTLYYSLSLCWVSLHS